MEYRKLAITKEDIQVRLLKWENWTTYDEDEGATYLPTGNYAYHCTSCARMVVGMFGGEVWGYSTKRNPTAVLGQNEFGHDFAIVAGHYLVDIWPGRDDKHMKNVVFDLEDKSDAEKVAYLYGDRSKWEKVNGVS